MQNGHPIAYASRALTETETRYMQIEKEMFAIVFSVEKINDYTFGRKTIVHTDHKPLELKKMQIEKEMFAIVFSVEKINDYTFGRKTIVH